MSNVLLLLILMMAAMAAILAGMSVFSNNRPPDARLNQVLDDMDEIKGLVNQLQKSILQLERKLDKDQKDARNEIKDLLDKTTERLERKVQELA